MKRNTALVSAASVVAVVVTGVTAIGANIGILASTDSGSVGSLNAVAMTDAPIDAQVIDVYVDGAAASGSYAATRSTALVGASIGSSKFADDQEFIVAEAGTVVVRNLDGAMRLLDTAVEPGWTMGQPKATVDEVKVTFSMADRTLIFVASVDEDGELSARVDEPIVEIVTIPAAQPAQTGVIDDIVPDATSPIPDAGNVYDDDDEYEDRDEYEDDDEYEDHEEYEEHEGADDDD